MDYEATEGYIGLGAESGLRPDGCFEGVHSVVRPPGYPKPLGLNRFGLLLAFLALVRTSKAVLRHQRGARGANVIRPGIRRRATGSRRRDAFGGRPSTDENGR